jgi:hypothetical protein
MGLRAVERVKIETDRAFRCTDFYSSLTMNLPGRVQLFLGEILYALLHICLSLQEVTHASFLGKKVEGASFWRKRIQFHKFFTWPCGFESRDLFEQIFIDPPFSRSTFLEFSIRGC